jgi:hypothetical protein
MFICDPKVSITVRRYGMTWHCGVHVWRPLSSWFNIGVGYPQRLELHRTQSGQWFLRLDIFLFWFCGRRRAWQNITFPFRKRLYGHRS